MTEIDSTALHFTALSDRSSASEAYFDAVATAIAAPGGEVLKFIGDDVLAIFPTGADRVFTPARVAPGA